VTTTAEVIAVSERPKNDLNSGVSCLMIRVRYLCKPSNIEETNGQARTASCANWLSRIREQRLNVA
jgi:hypothetical protein